MAPKPTRPTVQSPSSRMQPVAMQCFCCSSCLPSATSVSFSLTCRRQHSMSMTACSATARALEPRQLHTGIPACLAASRSNRLYPTPTPWISFSFGSDAISCASRRLFGSAISTSASGQAAVICALVQLPLRSCMICSCCSCSGRSWRRRPSASPNINTFILSPPLHRAASLLRPAWHRP